LEGFIVAAFRRDGLFDDVFGGTFNPAIDFEVYDGEKFEMSSLLYDNDGIQRAGEEGYDPLFTDEEQTRVAGRDWTLYFATLPEFEKGVAESNLPTFVLASLVISRIRAERVGLKLETANRELENANRNLEETNRELEGANRELEAFSYSVSHDLRAPLRSIEGFSQILLEDYATELDEQGRGYVGRVRAASRRMALLIDDLLDLSRVTRTEMRRRTVDLSALARDIVEELRKSQPEREVEFAIEEGLVAYGDARLLRLALENLLGNAWKFTSKKPHAKIEFGTTTSSTSQQEEHGSAVYSSSSSYFVRDNGAGFDARYSDKLFGAFQRLHGSEEFEGTGIGLATVARIVHRHGGRVWAEGEVGKGATFFFTLGGGHRRTPTSPTKTEKVT
jgi:signal transduction histidine kinase